MKVEYNDPIVIGDEIMTVEEFRTDVKSGFFTDYDGFGNPVKDNMRARNISIYPSKANLIPDDATHIIWYNR